MTEKNQKRRKCDNEEHEGLLECYQGIKLQLTEMNGTQKRHGRWFKDTWLRLKKIEDKELLEEGEKIGIGKLKTSTRNMIITVIMALGCLFAGIKVFQSSQMQLVTILEDKKIDIITNDSDRITKIEDSIDMLKNLIVTGVDK